jgi:zinc transport system ATP-binding protein
MSQNTSAVEAGSALAVERLSVDFDNRPVLRDLTFSVDKGTTLAIIGPNGAGKTVLLRALIGGLRSRGVIRWEPGTRIGYVPQKLDLQRDLPLTGLDLLRAKADVSGSPASEVANALQLVELTAPVAEQPIGTLSGGEFQRLLLAFALMGRPTMLLFDEPTAGLDEPGMHAVYDLLHGLQREQHLTTLLISHELSVVYEHADKVLCLSHTRTYFGSPAEVLTPDRLREVYGGRVRFHEHGDASH